MLGRFGVRLCPRRTAGEYEAEDGRFVVAIGQIKILKIGLGFQAKLENKKEAPP